MVGFAAFAALGIFARPGAAQDAAALRQGFLNPPDDAKPMMRWWWFGPAVVKPELENELETMHGAGIGGVEIQPVYPLMLDDQAKGIVNLRYLSPQFLNDVSFANQKARSLGMRVSITLGSGWPYGGPKTTLKLAAGKLKVIEVPVRDSQVAALKLPAGDNMIAAFLVKGDEKSFDPVTAKQFDPTAATPAAADGQTALYFISSHTGQMVKRAAYGAEGYVLDHFSRAAIDEHITDVAEPLLKAFGSEPPSSVFSDSLEVYGSDWTLNLPEEFKKRRGYDIVPHLPELVAGGTAEAASMRHDWGETLSELIRENYLEPLAQFAVAHETLFRSQTYGDPAVTLADEATPQLIEGEGPQWRDFSYARWATSAGHLNGRNVISAETWTWLHSPAFRATPLDVKAEADRMFLIGVNQFVGHGYPYSPPAAGEPGWAFYAAAVFNSHNPWFLLMPDVMRYLTRVSWLLRQGKPANDVAILLPEDDGQAAFTPGHVAVTDEMQKRITPELMGTILDAGYNVDYIDAATIDKLRTIPYPVLVIPPTERIPLAAYKKIATYANGRGHVIAIGKMPSLAPGLMEQGETPEIEQISDRLFQGAGHNGVLVASTAELGAALHRALRPDLDASGQAAGLGFIHRKLASSDIYFVANTGNEPMEGTVRFRAARKHIEEWDADSGDLLFAAPFAAGDEISLGLAPYESRVFVLTDHAAARIREQDTKRSPMHEQLLADLSTGWQIRFGNSEASQTLEHLISWTAMPGRQYYSGEADYTRNFALAAAPANDGHLYLDFGEGAPTVDTRPPGSSGMLALLDPPIREAAIIFVNGQRAGSLWHPPYRIDIARLVHAGENRIEVRVYNTAINELAGQPPHDYSALYSKYGKRFEPQDMQNLKPVPSGLFGAIRLVAESPE
ncbi:MAG: glycosyl hydrolase [Terracidiphilus sp.]